MQFACRFSRRELDGTSSRCRIHRVPRAVLVASSRMRRPKVDLLLTNTKSAGPILNLYPLYLHDVAAYEGKPPNQHGVLSDGAERTWDEVLDGQAGWWTNPGVLFPYLIRVDGMPAGFNLIASAPFAPTPGIDFVVHEFFVAHGWRGAGVAEDAAREGFDRHRGTWEVSTWPAAARALDFWRRTLSDCARDSLRESEEDDHPWGRRVVFRFDNRVG